MSSAHTPATDDPLLLPFLRAQDQAEEARCLAELLDAHIKLIVAPIIKTRLRLSTSSADEARLRMDAEDIYSEVRYNVLRRLRQLKAGPDKLVIGDFRGHVQATTHYACNRYLRANYPQRARLKNKLKYVLTHHPDFALWAGAALQLRCAGLVAWRGRQALPFGSQAHDQLRRDVQAEQLGLARGQGGRQKLPAVVSSIFRQADAPVELDELVNLVAEIMGVKDRPIVSLRNEDSFADYMVAVQPGAADEFEQRERLRQLWAEICQLPHQQRVALLLNLHDRDGDIMLFPFEGIASIRQIAEALMIPLVQFARLWQQLPLRDEMIAERLNVTRQQVVNLRKSARERLRRRLRAAARDPKNLVYVVMSLLIYHFLRV